MKDRKPKTESKAQTLSLASLLLHDLFSFQRTKKGKKKKNSPDCHRISLSPSSLRRRRTEREREKAKGRAINNCLKIEREREKKKGFLKRREEEGKQGSHLSISLLFFPCITSFIIIITHHTRERIFFLTFCFFLHI